MRRKAMIQSFVGFGIRLFVAVVFMLLAKASLPAESPRVFVPAGEDMQPLAVQMEYLEDTDSFRMGMC